MPAYEFTPLGWATLAEITGTVGKTRAETLAAARRADYLEDLRAEIRRDHIAQMAAPNAETCLYCGRVFTRTRHAGRPTNYCPDHQGNRFRQAVAHDRKLAALPPPCPTCGTPGKGA